MAIRLGGGNKMIKFDFRKIFYSNTLKNICLFLLIIVLCGCEKEDGMARGSEENFANQSKCWQTYLISAVVRVIDNLFDRGSNIVLSNQGATVIMMGFAIWMGFKFLKILPSFKATNLGETLTEIGQKLFLCAFCAWAASSKAEMIWLVDTFIVPIYDTILNLATNVTSVSPEASFNLGEKIGEVTFSNQYNDCSATLSSIGGSIKGAISPMVNCVVCSVSSRLNAGVRVGIELICSLNLAAMLLGILLIIFFTLAKFGFVLFMVDSLFRLNFTVHLIPLMIMALPFAYTRKWATHCVLMFLNSSGIMLFIGLLVSLAVNALEIIMLSIGPQLNAGQIENPGPLLMAMFMISLLLFNIPGLGVSLADKFIGGGAGDEFQKKISKFVVNLGKKALAAGFAYITGGASSAVTSSLEKYETTRSKLDSIRQTTQKVKDKLDSLAGYNDD